MHGVEETQDFWKTSTRYAGAGWYLPRRAKCFLPEISGRACEKGTQSLNSAGRHHSSHSGLQVELGWISVQALPIEECGHKLIDGAMSWEYLAAINGPEL